MSKRKTITTRYDTNSYDADHQNVKCWLCGVRIRLESFEKHVVNYHRTSIYYGTPSNSINSRHTKFYASTSVQQRQQIKESTLAVFLNYRQAKLANQPSNPQSNQPILPQVQAEISGFIVDETLRGKSAQRDTKDTIHIHPEAYRHNGFDPHREDVEARDIKDEAQRKLSLIRQTKRNLGLAEVRVGKLVLVEDIQAGDELLYYMASGKQEFVKGNKVYIENHSIPPGGADAVIRDNAPVGKALIGSFVTDVVTVHGVEEPVEFRILDVRECDPTLNSIDADRPVVKTADNHDKQVSEVIGAGGWDGLARDGGQFGSFTKHDNYGDESDAEEDDNDIFDFDDSGL